METTSFLNEETCKKARVTLQNVDACTVATQDIPLQEENEGEALANAQLELCFHSNAIELFPVVNAIFAPMGIWKRKDSVKRGVTKIELCPYVVPEVNHRTQNLQLLKNIVHQTILNKQPQKDLAASSTVLPFRMVTPVNADSTGLLHGYNSLDRAKLVGSPSAQLLHDPNGRFIWTDLDFLVQLLYGEGFGEYFNTQADGFYDDIRLKNNGVLKGGREKEFMGWVVYSFCKKLLGQWLSDEFQKKSTRNASQVFLNVLKTFVAKIPSLNSFFPYASRAKADRKETRHPFHHLRFLVGSMTLFRDAALEGCHRNFSQILALTNLPVPGSGIAKKAFTGKGGGDVVNSLLFFKPAFVYHLFPSVPEKTNQNEHKETVSHHRKITSFPKFSELTSKLFMIRICQILRFCRRYSAVLQTRKFTQETTSRDLFIQAIQSIPNPGYLPLHPCAIISRDPIWTQTETEFTELLERDDLKPPLAYFIKMCGKVMASPGKEKEKLNLKRLFCRECTSKHKAKKDLETFMMWTNQRSDRNAFPEFDMNIQTNGALRKLIGTDFDVGHRQQKLELWVFFCQHILDKMHALEKPLTVQLLLQRTLKLGSLPEANKENIDLAILTTLNKVVEKGSLTYVKASEVTKTNNPLYTFGGLYVDYCYSQEDVSNLESIFNRLPVGVGDYETLYKKPKNYRPPDNLPLQGGDVNSDTIKFLADLFYACTVPICRAVEENVVRGLERYHDENGKTFHKSAYPTKKLNTLLYPAVCSSWLKVLLKTGTIIFPTKVMKNVPGK
jgi:hypothetical protein